jgi:hypothetical protein
MLVSLIHAVRLFMLYRAILTLRRNFPNLPSGQPWFTPIRPHGINPLGIWGPQTLQTSEAVLVMFLKSDKQLLSTCPDVIFHFVAFAAIIMTGGKFLIKMIHGKNIDGFGLQLLEKAYRLCSEVSLSDDHSARRCAHLLGAMAVKWKKQEEEAANHITDDWDNPIMPPVFEDLFTTRPFNSQYNQPTNPETQQDQNETFSLGNLMDIDLLQNWDMAGQFYGGNFQGQMGAMQMNMGNGGPMFDHEMAMNMGNAGQMDPVLMNMSSNLSNMGIPRS